MSPFWQKCAFMKNKQQTQRPIGLSVPLVRDISVDRQALEPEMRAHSYHYHNGYEMYYLFSGNRYYFIKDKTYCARPGSLVLIKPYEIHCASRFSDEPYERMLISFKKDFIAPLVLSLGADLFRPFDKGVHIIELTREERELAEPLLAVMLSEYKSGDDAYEPILKTALCQLLAIASRHSEEEDNKESGFRDSVNKTVAEAAAYINNNYFEDITLASLSSRFYISPCYLSRTFKKVTGSSFVDYLNGVRIKESQRLLLLGDMKISAVADAVGFKSTTHFGRAFKMIVGKSPLEYKKQK